MTEDHLDLTALRVNKAIPAVPALLACKVSAVCPVALVLPASPDLLVNAVFPALTARTANPDPKVFKVFPDLLEILENAVLP